MTLTRRALLTAAAPGLLLGLWVVLVSGLLWATFAPAERDVLAQLLADRAALVLMAWLLASLGLGLLAWRLFADHVQALARLEEHLRTQLGRPGSASWPSEGAPGVRRLGEAAAALVAQRDALDQDMARQVRDASHRVELERQRLAALMAELTHSVVVCNLDGRILLYNQRARLQLRALAEVPGLALQAAAIGLGRTIHAVLEQALLVHALDDIRRKRAAGGGNPSTQFVTTTRSGALLRVQMAAVLEGTDISGYVLVLDDVTREFEQTALRDRLLHDMTEGSRGSLASMQAALDMLSFADIEPAMRDRFLGVVRDEASGMAQRVQTLSRAAAQGLQTRWPLEHMRGSDLLAAAARRIEVAGALEVAIEAPEPVPWLRVDSFSLVQALASLAARLHGEFPVRGVRLRVARADAHAHLDLVWTGQAVSTETVMGWELDPIRSGQHAMPLSVRDVVERHGGAFWFERERTRHEAFFRFLLPLADAGPAPDAPEHGVAAADANDARPEYYDFDLFAATRQDHDLDARPLAGLSYTVFDTETTGLEPSAGDEIVQIGATRIVNGRVLHHEGFEQLVDPQRAIAPASVAVHGITAAMVQGQPTIAQVLPVFHAYAQDTVLVAHNAAFDMRFLQEKEGVAGVRFDQPVLDTLLLSAVVHPGQESHALDAIAARLGVPVEGRHTALADATVTAQIFLRLLPLLAEQGITTLGQARTAAQATWHARLRY